MTPDKVSESTWHDRWVRTRRTSRRRCSSHMHLHVQRTLSRSEAGLAHRAARGRRTCRHSGAGSTTVPAPAPTSHQRATGSLLATDSRHLLTDARQRRSRTHRTNPHLSERTGSRTSMVHRTLTSAPTWSRSRPKSCVENINTGRCSNLFGSMFPPTFWRTFTYV